MQDTSLDDKTVAVVGLGYMGLPLAVEFGKRLETIGYDLSEAKLDHCRRGQDPAGGVGEGDMGGKRNEYPKKLEKGGCFVDVKSRFDAKAFASAGTRVRGLLFRA
jgi:hypothetical protein